MTGLVALGHFDLGSYYIIQTISTLAVIADKMNMMIVVMTSGALVLAKRIADGVIGRGDTMNDSFFQKSLQGAVDGNSVKFFTGPFFNVTMGQCPLLLQK